MTQNTKLTITILQILAVIFFWLSGFFSGILYALKNPPEDLSLRSQQIIRYEQKDL